MEVPDGWLQVIRGKRPPSTQWSRARSQQQVRQPGKIVPYSKKPLTQPPSISRQSVLLEELGQQQLRGSRGSRHPSALSSQRTQKRGRFCCRRRDDKRKFLHWRNRFLPRRSRCQSEEAPLATRCHHCRGQGGIAESRTRQRSRCARCRRRRRSLAEIKVTTSRSGDANIATCGSRWRSGPSSANGRGSATPVAAPWCSCGPTGGSCGPITNFSFPDSQEGGLRSSDGTRGVGVDGRPSRGHDCCTHSQEHNRSSSHFEFDHGRNQELPSRIGASVLGHQHGAVRGSKEVRTRKYGLRGTRVGEAVATAFGQS